MVVVVGEALLFLLLCLHPYLDKVEQLEKPSSRKLVDSTPL
ncbi:MAG: hypothetical protein ACI92C_000166 [Neolewinella sp.]